MTQIDEHNLDSDINDIFARTCKNNEYFGYDGWYELHTPTARQEIKALIATQIQEARIDERNNCWKDFHKSYAVGDKSGDYIILGIEKKIHANNRKFRVECYWCGGVMFRYSNKFKVKHIMCNCWRDECKRETRLADRIAQLRSKQ